MPTQKRIIQTSVTRNGKKYNVRIAKDKNGYYACALRVRTRSYPSIDDIPVSALKRVEKIG
ncbi:MAG TPA: hypothetical protein GXX36_03320 [Clostridiaceae bacterium]|nr:hypothetical protein [Clostridiaceae bacterium]